MRSPIHGAPAADSADQRSAGGRRLEAVRSSCGPAAYADGLLTPRRSTRSWKSSKGAGGIDMRHVLASACILLFGHACGGRTGADADERSIVEDARDRGVTLPGRADGATAVRLHATPRSHVFPSRHDDHLAVVGPLTSSPVRSATRMRRARATWRCGRCFRTASGFSPRTPWRAGPLARSTANPNWRRFGAPLRLSGASQCRPDSRSRGVARAGNDLARPIHLEQAPRSSREGSGGLGRRAGRHVGRHMLEFPGRRRGDIALWAVGQSPSPGCSVAGPG